VSPSPLSPSTLNRLATEPAPAWDAAGFVRRHQKALWRYLRALGADAATAEDVLQDALVVALRRGIEDRGDAAVGTFLRRTARFILLRRVRDEGRKRAALIERAAEAWEHELADRDGEDAGTAWRDALLACIARLQPRARRAVEAAYREGRSRRQIGAELELSDNGVKTLMQRSREALRLCIEQRRSTHR